MIFGARRNGQRAIELLEHHDPGQMVRKGHGRHGEPQVSPLLDCRVQAFARANDQRDARHAARRQCRQAAGQLFAMTPYAFKTPAEGVRRLAGLPSLTTEIGFRFLVYRRLSD